MELTIRKPDDLHVHLRDGPWMANVLPHTAMRFRRAVVMPNLDPPVTTTAAALAYRARILDALPRDLRFEPLMTLYLTEETAIEEIRKAKLSGYVVAVKYYPAGGTTHSNRGVADIRKVYPVLAELENLGMPLLLHGEIIEPAVDFFDRESVFIERILGEIIRRFPGLKLVLEHITTRAAVEYVRAGPATLAATITAHHLLLNRNALFQGGLQPHYYCLPLLKTEEDRQALVQAATSANPKFFLGTDSAPHARAAKERACGCAGIYTAHAALELYAEVFDGAGSLDRLDGFASGHGAAFYGLPRTSEKLTLRKAPMTVPRKYPFGSDELVPFRAGAACGWALVTHE
ncbi:MAG: dihydroorotase [Gammaproteobacteria bacterium]